VAPSILVVEDEQDISMMLHDRLSFQGFVVTTARDGAEGLAMLEVLIVDGILLDIQMPVMDGLSMLEQVRERFPSIPVIVMSAELNKKKLLKAIERGAHDYLLKPIDVDLLAKKCSTAFGASWVDSDREGTPSATKLNYHDSSSTNVSGGIKKVMNNMKRILIVDDFKSGRQVLREKLEIYGYACQEVENGSEALKAIETDRFDLVITDNKMPVMTGLEFLQSLAERPEDQRPPAIFLTGQLSDPLSKAAQNAGAWAVMQKPYKDQELISEITRVIESR